MGIPLLFTPVGTPTRVVVPFPGLYPSDELFPGDDVYPDDGPTLDFYATAPEVDSFGITVEVDPEPVTFSATVPSFTGADADLTIPVDPVPVLFTMPLPSFTGLPIVVDVDPLPVTFSMEVPQTSGGQFLILVPSVRELPPLRLHLDIETPSGRHFRWAEDEPNPANVPSGLRFSDTMPGGFENQDATLPRKTGMSAADLERLSNVRVLGAGGELAWEGRLERAPRVSGDQVSVSPSAVGWQAHLEDDKSARMPYVDIDLSRWQGASSERKIGSSGTYTISEASVSSDDTVPSLRSAFQGPWSAAPGLPLVESWYDAGPGAYINFVYTAWKNGGGVNSADPNWNWDVLLSSDRNAVDSQSSGNLRATGPAISGLSANSGTRRYAAVRHFYALGGGGGDNVEYAIAWTYLAVYGNSGVPVYGPQTATSAPGVFASDVIAHAVQRWAPLLKVSVSPSSFVIPHLSFLESTTSAEIVRGASRFGLQDWAVWDDKTFWWHDRGARGRKWRARTGPAQLEETGESLERTWNSVIVQYSDVDGSTKTVGPPGSGSDFEDSVLNDPDPQNPATKAGVIRRALLTMGTAALDPFTGKPGAPIQIGRRFLQEQKLLDRSGRARFVGHVEDDRGVLHPYWAPRSGDTVSFIDAEDKSERRIVRTEKDHASRTCSVDLDAPPEGLQALLERFGVGIQDLGLS